MALTPSGYRLAWNRLRRWSAQQHNRWEMQLIDELRQDPRVARAAGGLGICPEFPWLGKSSEMG
jgi:hypothetical protein